MLHLRAIVPGTRVDAATSLLLEHPAVTNVVVLPAAAREPPGDLVLCDVAREQASEVLGRLRDLGVDEAGSLALEKVDVMLSDAAREAEDAAPGYGTDAVVWEEVEERTNEEATLSATYIVFLTVATLIAGVGVLLDQIIPIIGAMVVGPEFGALAGVCVGLVQRRLPEVTRSFVALAVGFVVAIVVTAFLTWAAARTGLVSATMLRAPRPLTSFIWHPTGLSFVVAFLAGVAGMLSLTSAKSGALVGVLISVTTVPAAANGAVALALADPPEALGAFTQLGINLAAILCAGTLTLLVQKVAWAEVRRPGQRPGH